MRGVEMGACCVSIGESVSSEGKGGVCVCARSERKEKGGRVVYARGVREGGGARARGRTLDDLDEHPVVGGDGEELEEERGQREVVRRVLARQLADHLCATREQRISSP
eukprot:3743383-Rhodomonas_salina.2